MRKVVVQEFVTLDGYAAGPNGELEFISDSTQVDPTAGDAVDAQLRFLETVETILLGAVTYRMFAQYWPEQTTETEAIADALNRTPKIVFSRTLEKAPWGSWGDATILRGDPPEEVGKLKQEDGKDMVVWGSLTLVRSLVAEGLVDEYRLWLCPVLLGAGQRLFPEGDDTRRMEWVETTQYEGGVLSASFRSAA